MKSSRIFFIFAVLGTLSFQFGGWQAGIQMVHGEDKIDFSKIELSQQQRIAIAEKMEKFLARPGDPEEGIPIVGKDDIKNLSLGDALKIFHIRLNSIRNYRPEMDPRDVLIPAEGGIAPLYLLNQQTSAKSKIISFAPLIRSLEEKSDSAKYQSGVPRNLPDYALLFKAWKDIENEKAGPPFGIFYPVMGIYFLGYENERGEFKIKVLHDGPGDLKKGQNLNAKDVFVELAKDANKQPNIEFEASGNPLERFRQFQSGQ